ncbi:tyrosine-protein kinase JAK2-like, partial [Portunus trituberculatus]|uniref:tyrosine-protein kinase JAK2-like n=1 Tax=Portunus trituberculatus TaxID=210409 RepID=UPI001E1CE4BE
MLTIAFYGDWPHLVLPQDSDQTVEDILVAAARVLGISPLCRHLFGLRNCSNRLWVSLGRAVERLPANPTLEFRLRFKPFTLDRLKGLDRCAFDYLFHQVRADFLAGEIPELIKHPEDGLGLVVTDVLLHLLNNPGRKVGDIDLKSFMPRELNGMANRLNVKRNAEKLVETCQNREASFVRERYLFKVEESQCGYGSEEYSVLRDEGGAVHSARLCIDPYHPEHPGLRYSHSPSKKASWSHLCCIEDLVFVTTRSQDLTVEVSRKTGVPCYFKLSTMEELEAMVGCLTGYYRLMCTWTFDLCRELSTPSLVFLRSSKCHGPIGSIVSARKLQEKGGSEVGVGLLRESSTEYDTFLLDVVVEANAPPHCYTILRQGDNVCVCVCVCSYICINKFFPFSIFIFTSLLSSLLAIISYFIFIILFFLSLQTFIFICIIFPLPLLSPSQLHSSVTLFSYSSSSFTLPVFLSFITNFYLHSFNPLLSLLSQLHASVIVSFIFSLFFFPPCSKSHLQFSAFLFL